MSANSSCFIFHLINVLFNLSQLSKYISFRSVSASKASGQIHKYSSSSSLFMLQSQFSSHLSSS